MVGIQDSVLRVYRAKSGQWSGVLHDETGYEICRIAGCHSPDDVQDSAIEAGMCFDRVAVEHDV